MPAAPPHHDRSPGTVDRSAGPVLHRELDRIHLSGAIFLRGDYSEAWAYESLESSDAAAVLAPEAPQVVLLHVVASGTCWIEAGDSERLWAHTGDVIVLPYNDRHRMGGREPAALTPIRTLLEPPPWSSLPFIVLGRGGARTSVVCGYLACDDALFDRRMRVFPPVFVVSPPEGAARQWMRASIEYALQRTSQVSENRIEAPTDIPELLLREVLKLHLASAPVADTGWLRALHDPVVAPALAALHAEPQRKWTVSDLARESRVSSTVLDDRFRTVLGIAPIGYLAGWRMHVAGNLLRTTDLPVAVVARRIGYESEEAFSRAFKRARGEAPSVWRVRR